MWHHSWQHNFNLFTLFQKTDCWHVGCSSKILLQLIQWFQTIHNLHNKIQTFFLIIYPGKFHQFFKFNPSLNMRENYFAKYSENDSKQFYFLTSLYMLIFLTCILNQVFLLFPKLNLHENGVKINISIVKDSLDSTFWRLKYVCKTRLPRAVPQEH